MRGDADGIDGQIGRCHSYRHPRLNTDDRGWVHGVASCVHTVPHSQFAQDMENAGMHGGAGGEAEEARVARLAELEALREEVCQVRQKLTLRP